MAATASDPIASDAPALARFCVAVQRDAALLARLEAIEQDDVFVSAAVALAAERGFALAADSLARAIRSGAGLTPVLLDHWPAAGWIPSDAVAQDDTPLIDWVWTGASGLTAPFYGDTVRRAKQLPLNRLLRVRCTLDALIAGAPCADAPDGLIFHASRCGSTWVAQMLAAVPHHRVASEPEPLDAVVQWAATSDAPVPRQVAALRAIAAAICRAQGARQRSFLKLDSWHTRALPLFRKAFPDTSWIFLYRDPIEVMVSHMRRRGVQTVAGGLPWHVFEIADGKQLSGERYCAEALARTCEPVGAHWEMGGGMLVNYSELPAAMALRIPRHFGFTPDPDEAAAMATAAARNAKAPLQAFVPDGAVKRAEASDAIRREVAARLAPIHAELEGLRRTRTGAALHA